MKKFVLSLLIVFSFMLCGASVFLLNGCGPEASTPGEENPDDVETGSNFTYTVRVVARYGSGASDYYIAGLNNTADTAGGIGRFHSTWYNSSGNAESTTHTHYQANGYSEERWSSNNGYKNLKALDNKYSDIWGNKRILGIDPYTTDSTYACFGVTKSTDNSSARSTNASKVYMYTANGTLTTNFETAKSGCDKNVQGTAYVVWRKKYTVTYNANGGSGGASSGTMYAGVGYSLSSSYPTKTGYTFANWTTTKDNSATARTAFSDSEANSNKTVYAYWVPNTVTVNLDVNGGSKYGSAYSSIYLKYNTGWYSDYYCNTSISTLSTASNAYYKVGYSLQGFYTTSATSGGTQVTNGHTLLTTSSALTFASSGQNTVYARWSPYIYTYTLNANGGSGGYVTSSSTQTLYQKYNTGWYSNSGATTSVSSLYSRPSRTGYDFAGYWDTSSSSGGTQFINSSGTIVAGTTNTYGTTLYARWTPHTYSVLFSANGGSGSMSSQSMTYGTSYNLTSNSFTRAGYSFAGWATSSTGDVVYSNGQSVSNLTSTNGGTVYLYAKWTPQNATTTVYIRTSSSGGSYTSSASGGTVKITRMIDSGGSPTSSTSTSSGTSLSVSGLINYGVTITATANSGYVFMGFSTSNSAPTYTSAPSTSTTFTPASTSTYARYAFFKQKGALEVKSDSKGYYVDYGLFPQTRMTSTPSGLSNTGKAFYFVDANGTTQSCPIYYSAGVYYALYGGSYYRFETIRWRVIQTGWGNYGSYQSNLTIVSEKILFGGAVVASGNMSSVTDGWGFASSLLADYVSQIKSSLSSYTGLTNNTASVSAVHYNFASASNEDKVTSTTTSGNNLRVATEAEITAVGDKQAVYTDLSAAICGGTSGANGDYWTRELGTYLKEAKIITSGGIKTSSTLNYVNGVRLAYTITSASRT